jgi:RNA polymerase II subunit A small phosphatase-like protein
MSAAPPILLILDLDETLIHACDPPFAHAPLFVSDPYSVYPRPGLAAFLSGAAGLFELAVWSSARADDVQEVVAHIFPAGVAPSFVWARDRCTLRPPRDWGLEPYWIKDLKKVRREGYDDTPQKLERHHGNAIYIPAFEGDLADAELPRLLQYLHTLAGTDNVRTLEKRYWRSRFLP